MATFLRSPNSPTAARTFYYDDDTHRSHTANKPISVRMSDPVGVAEDAPTPSRMRGSRSSKPRQPLRTASVPRRQPSQNSQKNRSVVELLQDVQTELVAHREIMLDMQSRLDRLEDASHNSNKNNNMTKPPVPPKQTRRSSTRTQIRTSEDLTREAQKRWEAPQSHVQDSNQPFIATDFAYSTKRLSGFDFDLLRTIPASPHLPQDERTPDTAKRPTAYTPGNRRIPPRLYRAPASEPAIMYHNAVSDIRENVVDFDLGTTSLPTVLHIPPPRSARSKGAPAASRDDDDITALPAMPLPESPVLLDEHPRQGYKGLKRLFMYKASLKKSRGESEEKSERRSFSSLRC
jgi:hypothetical protein